MPTAYRHAAVSDRSAASSSTAGRVSSSKALLAILAFLASTAAVSLFTVDDLARRAEALWAAGRPRTLGNIASVLGWPDALLFLIAGIAAVALAFIEWRDKAVSRLLENGSRGQFLLLLFAVLLWLSQYCFVPGLLLGGDAAGHITRFHEVRQALASGHLPLWTNDQYLGSALLAFTGPLTYILGGSIDLLVRDPVVTGKIFLLAAKIGAGFAFYKLLGRLHLSAAAAFAGAIGLVGSFAYVHLFLYRGVYPEALIIAFIPILFYAAEGLMTSARPRARDWALFAATTACMIVTHQPHALFAAYYLAIFGLVSLVTKRWHLRGMLALVTAGTTGVITSMVAVIPILAQSSWVMIAPGSAFLRFRLPTATRLMHLVVWRDTLTTSGSDYWAYLGLALLGIACLGAWAAVSGRLGPDHRRLALAALACLPLTLVTWNPVVRDVMFILFFVAILGGLGVQWLLVRKPLRGYAHTLAIAALLLDTGSTAVQPVARLDKGFLLQAGRYIAHIDPQRRIMEIPLHPDGRVGVSIGPNATPMSFYADVQRIAGTHNMAATLVHNYVGSIAMLARHDLRTRKRLSTPTTQLLAMLNVGEAVCWSALRMGCPSDLAPVPDGPLGGVLPVAGPSPVLFSRRLLRLDPSPGLDKPMLWPAAFGRGVDDPQVTAIKQLLSRFLEITAPAKDHRASALAVRVLPSSWVTTPHADEAGWQTRLVSYHVGLQRVELHVQTNHNCYVQLAFPWYPGTKVTVNGRRTVPLEGAISLMVVRLPAGDDRIVLSPFVTPAELIAAAVSVFGLLLLAGGAVYLRVRRVPVGRGSLPTGPDV